LKAFANSDQWLDTPKKTGRGLRVSGLAPATRSNRRVCRVSYVAVSDASARSVVGCYAAWALVRLTAQDVTAQWDVFLSCKVGRSLQHNRRRADLGIARCWLSCSWTTIGYLARQEFRRRCNSRLTGQPRCWTSTVIYGLAASTSQLGSLRDTRYTDNASMYIESRENMGRKHNY
jgi:hypothetical protein